MWREGDRVILVVRHAHNILRHVYSVFRSAGALLSAESCWVLHEREMQKIAKIAKRQKPASQFGVCQIKFKWWKTCRFAASKCSSIDHTQSMFACAHLRKIMEKNCSTQFKSNMYLVFLLFFCLFICPFNGDNQCFFIFPFVSPSMFRCSFLSFFSLFSSMFSTQVLHFGVYWILYRSKMRNAKWCCSWHRTKTSQIRKWQKCQYLMNVIVVSIRVYKL